MPHFGDDFIDLVAGKLTALAGLRALRHLDLELIGVDEIIHRHAAAAGGHLFDRAAAGIAIGVAPEARFVFPALAGIGTASDAVHRDRQRFVRFLRNRAE